jgi:hypothetical protein
MDRRKTLKTLIYCFLIKKNFVCYIKTKELGAGAGAGAGIA